MRARFLIFLLLIFVVHIFGCKSFSPVVKPTEIPKGDLAYVYGRFKHSIHPKTLGQSYPIALVMTSHEDEKEYRIRFQRKDEVFAIAVYPGQYYISKWLCAFLAGETKAEQSLAEHIQGNNFYLMPGNAYYLGDFLAYECPTSFQLSPIVERFVLEIPVNNFDKTTNDFRVRYPSFNEVPVSQIFIGRIFKEQFDKKHMIIVKTRVHFIPIVVPH